MFNNNPHIQQVTNKEEPPDEKNGRVIPVTGRAPHTTPQFSKDWITIQVVSPKAVRAENLLLLSIIKV